ncbi:serine/threonine protein kinase [Gigaspora margarita]|uniref:Serine/threonine protein kinase n=1 Tax=Gigaspora margarita TaxID=4874 RepID=A0A8H3X7V0_GIGMA|nr:serine/threonine protein kinase [Gigaspora margarita]
MSTSSKSDLSFDCVMKCIKSFQRMLMTPLKSSPKSENVVYATSETSEISYPACDECYEYHYNQHNPSFYCQPSQGGFSTVYSAVLVDGPMQRFDLSKRQWSRAGVSRVIFKEFHNSKDSSFQFLEEIQVYLRIGGAVYKSRILKFKSLPKPINANGVIVNKLSINKARLNDISPIIEVPED